ncbi:TIGR04282 family arsenosugar biosynthesis glycosyltransferase [Fodinicurvata sediminis]|uniref:TIGR04282 family arsenosugar biosynthesis glycosyltransferase n=1 Tax=Fodinicurvata sediminis TaxID=1121832 RepID=UPI0003B3EE21|nr:DUF2064 domain-containing protein [Fodinicurvata sediminis]
MRSPARLVIMARQPLFGTGKRRLAAQCGELAAWQFQRRNLDRLVRKLGNDPRWRLELALTPHSAHAPIPPARHFPRHRQQAGDLGQRILGELFPPHRKTIPGPCLVIGADIAAVRPRHILRALRAVHRCDWVLGPAEDGGFWLIGTRVNRRKAPDFTGVPWGTAQAFEIVRQRLPGSCALVDRLYDVDEASDLERWRHEG